jgi:hypothetical protein
MRYRFSVTFINDAGETVNRVVRARHEFEAVQIAGAFGKIIISVVNQDR